MDYKDRSKIEAVLDKFCEENSLDKDARARATLFGKITLMQSGQGKPLLTERKKWTRDNFDFLRTTLCAILQQKVNSGLPRGLLLKPVQQQAHHPDGKLCTRNRSRILLALAKLQGGITELKDIVVKKFGDDKPDNLRLGFCDFLKVRWYNEQATHMTNFNTRHSTY